MSSFTVDVIENYLIVELARRGIKGILCFFPINQFEQQILDNSSDLYKFNPDLVIFFPSIEDMCTNEIGYIKQRLIKGLTQRYKFWINQLRKKSKSTIVAANYQTDFLNPFALDEGQDPRNLNTIISENNQILSKFCKAKENCFIFDLYNLLFKFGSKNWTDIRFLYIGQIRQSYKAQIFLAEAISRMLAAIFFVPKKCIILDADNTLWGGVIGEEGIDGIELSDSYPGNVFKDFHKYLLRQRSRGVILAIVSKNEFRNL